MLRTILAATMVIAAGVAQAETLVVTPQPVTEWKAVHGRVEARDRVPARARIGGTIVTLEITEGDRVDAGQTIALVRDDKLGFQIEAIAAQLAALQVQLEQAESELARGETLVKQGVVTAQRLDQLKTDVNVTRNQIAAREAEKALVEQQQAEGAVLAPQAGLVLSTPATMGGVVMAGEPVAMIGGGGFFLRLSLPERHAGGLEEGASIRVTTAQGEKAGTLAKIYPEIENGRVTADVEVDGLDTAFVNARVLVQLPVGERMALLVPAQAVTNRFGIDFVMLEADGDSEGAGRAVIVGETVERDGAGFVEIVSGLASGDRVVLP